MPSGARSMAYQAPREGTWEQVSSRCRSLVGLFATCHLWAWHATAADMSLRPMCGRRCRGRTAAMAVPSVYPDVALGNSTSRGCRTGMHVGVVGAALIKMDREGSPGPLRPSGNFVRSLTMALSI